MNIIVEKKYKPVVGCCPLNHNICLHHYCDYWRSTKNYWSFDKKGIERVVIVVVDCRFNDLQLF